MEDKRGFYQDSRREDSQYGSYNYGGYYSPAAAGGYAAGPYYAPAYAAWAPASGRPPPSMQYQGFTPHAHAFNDMHSTTVHHRPHFDQRRENFFHNEEEEDKEEEAADERKWRGRTAGPSDSLSIHRTIKDGRLPCGLYSEAASMSTELPRMDIDNVTSKAEIVAKVAYEKLLTEKKGVTLWKLVQATLLELNSESLDSLGISLHDVPSLRKLLVLEGKVNTYIHCHVAVRRITTLHDLSVEISQNEGVKDFDDLKLGPISCHPLVGQYFAFPGGFEVSRICTEDVLNHMSDYMNKHLGKIQVEDFLSFMTKARSLPSPQHLGVRIQSFGMYVSFIRREKKLEKAIASHRASLVAVRETSFKQEVQGPSITKRIDEFLASAVAERAQHVSLSSDDEGSTKFTSNVMVDTQKVALTSSHSQLNNCPYPSAAEERVRICAKLPADVNEELLRTEYALSKQQLGDFVAAWRGFCHKNSVSDVLMQMLFANGMESKKSLKKKKKLAKLFKGYPAIGILNVAILSMKAGHWNSMYDAFEEAVSSDAYETKGVNNVEAVERIEIVSSERHPSVSNVLDAKDSSTDSIKVLDEILVMLRNICEDISNSTVEASDEEKFSLISKRIIKCERTLIEHLLQRKDLNFNFKDSSQFSCKFKDSSEFVELYVDRISRILSELWAKKVESNLDIILAEGIVRTFIYQVSTAIENIDGLPENIIAQLLAKQFHLLNASEWCLHVVKKHIKALKSKRASSSLLFYSCALLAARTGNMSVAVNFEKNQGIEMKNVPRVGSLGSVTSMDARNCLLKAPMLCNLLEWSQWNTVFSPTLGPLLDWLEREGTAGELVCLVTCEGSILRIDGSATVDSFLAAAAKGLGT